MQASIRCGEAARWLALAPAGVAARSALLEYQSPTAALIARPVPLASRYITWVIAAMFAAVLAVVALLPIDRVVTAAGKVTAVTGNLMVQPLERRSLSRASINVKEGQLVHAGDVLAELDPTFAQADAGSLETQVASLQAEVDRLTAETQNRPYLSDGSAAGAAAGDDVCAAARRAQLQDGGLRAEDRGGAGEGGAGASRTWRRSPSG